ncbi:hypothetical protein CLV98_10313 [Dyadobacter jejuensis]|uniref:Uncharacterized protein n=1 Tax=Dyadobacter jejuensis TaxID=1082580 RepID=A0A316AMI2_9BACT|nr:hypothetical protein CLV98_10313 [Dyadobacter jejuensis]
MAFYNFPRIINKYIIIIAKYYSKNILLEHFILSEIIV